jgi:hypothetical protein
MNEWLAHNTNNNNSSTLDAPHVADGESQKRSPTHVQSPPPPPRLLLIGPEQAHTRCVAKSPRTNGSGAPGDINIPGT